MGLPAEEGGKGMGKVSVPRADTGKMPEGVPTDPLPLVPGGQGLRPVASRTVPLGRLVRHQHGLGRGKRGGRTMAGRGPRARGHLPAGCEHRPLLQSHCHDTREPSQACMGSYLPWELQGHGVTKDQGCLQPLDSALSRLQRLGP